MKRNRPTPGPWHVDSNGIHICRGSYTLASCYGANGHGQIPAETEANARLIAASPDLLGFVRTVAEWYEDGDAPLHSGALLFDDLTVKQQAIALLVQAGERVRP